MRKLIILMSVLAVLVAGCGDDDSGGDLTGAEEAVVDAIVAGMTEDSDPENPFSEPGTARCFAVGAVRDLGIGRLAQVGLTAESDSPEAAFAALTSDEIDDLADRALGCVDIEEAMAPQFAVDGISDGSARCMVRELNETGFFRSAFIAGMTGDDTYDPGDDPEMIGLMITVATECLTDEELALIMGG